MLLAVGTLCLMAGCSSKVSSSKGIVSDATMNTVTIVTDKNDTLSFSTMDANKEEVNGLLLNDTLEVFYTGKYTPGMPATKLVQYPQSPLVGGDRDEHGCIGPAGYVWCEVQKTVSACLRKGFVQRRWMIVTLLLSLFLVPILHSWNFSFSNNQPNEILERRSLPSGGYAWNVEDDDTKNVRLIDGLWTISQRDKLIYTQKGGS